MNKANNRQPYSVPILGSHCIANIVVRSDSIAIQFLVGFLRRHVEFSRFAFTAPVETGSSPYYLLVEMPGTAPGSKTSILQRVQNHHHLRDIDIIIFTVEISSF